MIEAVRKSVSLKITLAFIGILLLSMLTIGGVFLRMFQGYAFESKKDSMLTRAQEIASTTSPYLSNSPEMRGYGAFIRMIDKLADARIWITDTAGNVLIVSSGESYATLPDNAKSAMKDVVGGSSWWGVSFNEIYREDTVTVGVPVVASSGDVTGAVFLHAPVAGITDTIMSAARILMAGILIALGVSSIMILVYSYTISKPIIAINDHALRISKGDFAKAGDVARKDEIGQLASSFNMMAGELEKLETLRRDFIANASHELRTPLTVIRGSIEAISDGTVDSDDDIAMLHEKIRNESRVLEKMVYDLLDLSKLDSGQFTLDVREMDAISLVDDVRRSLLAVFKDKGVELESTVSGEPRGIMGDYYKLRQVLVIFLDNALKFGPEGSKVTIHVDFSMPFRIGVSDDGPGISAEDQKRIFERFYMSDKSRRDSRNSGLGLSIAKSIVELHGGSVYISSEEGRGTEVGFRLENPVPGDFRRSLI